MSNIELRNEQGKSKESLESLKLRALSFSGFPAFFEPSKLFRSSIRLRRIGFRIFPTE